MTSKYDDYDARQERSARPSASPHDSHSASPRKPVPKPPAPAPTQPPPAPTVRQQPAPTVRQPQFFAAQKKPPLAQKPLTQLPFTKTPKPPHRQQPASFPPTEESQALPSDSDQIPVSSFGMKWLRSWPVLVLIIFGILGTTGAVAMVSLFRIPNLPNCRAIFWPTASASLRLQCAESYAAQGDVENLLAAIALVDHLPDDHPLRNDINARIEDWATLVLDLAEQSFEEGEIEKAIESARKIPAKTAAAAVVEARIARWQIIWKEGESKFNTAIEKIKEKDFQAAFTLSVELLDVDNKYWSTEKYNELTKKISLAREDSRRLSEALGFAKEGTLKGYKEALKRLKEISKESVFYAEAQGKRKDIAKEMLEVSEGLLADRQLSAAQAMLNAIPRDVDLDEEIADFQIFVTAYQQAWSGNVNGLGNAISRLKAIGKNRPAYAKAQQLIGQWEAEIQDIALLNQAKERASRGSTADLSAAIEIASRISRDSAQWDNASAEISEWRTRVETVQDRPILDRADQLASVGSADNLRAAIQEARKISSGRTLASEANRRIASWTERIQRIEDEPILNQARQTANRGDRAGAIAIASRISEGRALYESAQEEIGRWQAEENGRQRLGESINVAAGGDADSLANAIDLALKVPENSESRASANSQIDRWSWELLRQAESVALGNLGTAIGLASRIPSQAEAYEAAQGRLRDWQAAQRQIEEAGEEAREEAERRAAPSPAPNEVDANGLPNSLELVAPGE